MFDWAYIAVNSLWILGCSLALATLSYASWQAWARQEKFWARLRSPAIRLSLDLSGLLFCLGLAGTTQKKWEMLIWLLLAAFFLFQVLRRIWYKNRERVTMPLPQKEDSHEK